MILPEILAMVSVTGNQHDDYDVAQGNLLAAHGLPGAEGRNFLNDLDWIDHVAKTVRIETLRHSYQFRDNPSAFENCPAYFCMLVLATVMYQQFGVRYNPARIRDPKFQDPYCLDPDFSDSRDLFIHGMIGGPGGTCASMPVLKAAVGRRLGYPLKLVEAKGHLFLRWDDVSGEQWRPGARFNIEATCEGLACPPDEHYLRWPHPMDERDLTVYGYMQPLTPPEETAMFRSTRAICLWENGNYAECLRECHWAIVLAPHRPQHCWQIMDFYKKYRAVMATKTREEVAKLALYFEEEHAIQENIVFGHQERLRRGRPGFNLAEFGVFTPAEFEARKQELSALPGIITRPKVEAIPSVF
ncbi:MAG TPA: hypothetical protein VKS79_02755 [Gemmataceae bacterium]|nr:hypothetical protein [Gemmataceae bacterium]